MYSSWLRCVAHLLLARFNTRFSQRALCQHHTQTLRTCVLAPGALPNTLMTGALLALLCDFGPQARAQLRGARAAAAAGSLDVRCYDALLALKVAAELGGAALAAFAPSGGCAGATLVLAGHLAWNGLNDVYIGEYGTVHPSPLEGRLLLVRIDAALTALGLAACAAQAAACPPAALAASAAFSAGTGGWVLFKAVFNSGWLYW
jgi:hypothetical protein